MITFAEAQFRFARRYLTLLIECLGEVERGGERVAKALARFDLEWPNIEKGQAWAAEECGRNEDAAALSEQYATVGTALMMYRRSPGEQARWARTGFAAAQLLAMTPHHQAKHLLNLGTAQSRGGDHQTAVETTMEAFRVLQQTEGPIDPQALAIGHSNLAMFYTSMRDPASAADHAQRAIDLAESIDDLEVLGNATSNLAHATFLQGDLPRAQELYERDLAIARRRADVSGEALTLASLGMIAAKMGDPPRGRSMVREALRLVRTVGDRTTEARVLAIEAEIAPTAGDANLARSGAIDAARRAGAKGIEDILRDEMESPSALRERQKLALQAQLTGNRVSELIDRGDFKEALKLAEENLPLQRKVSTPVDLATGLFNLGVAYRGRKRYAESRKVQAEALEVSASIGDEEGEMLSAWELAKLAERGRDREATTIFAARALRIALKLGSPHAPAIAKTLSKGRK